MSSGAGRDARIPPEGCGMAADSRNAGSKAFVRLLAGLLLAAPVAAQRDERGVDDLRGRAREATFANGRYTQAGIAFDVPANWTYDGTVAGETSADEAAHWTDPES